MEVHFTPELERKLNDIAALTGRKADELVQDVMAGYADELAETREMLDGRYDDLTNGRVEPVNGEEFFEKLQKREDELLKPRLS
jgi:hypothetical protein